MIQRSLLVAFAQDVLFDGVLCDEPVNVDLSRLPNAMAPVLSLCETNQHLGTLVQQLVQVAMADSAQNAAVTLTAVSGGQSSGIGQRQALYALPVHQEQGSSRCRRRSQYQLL